MDGPAGLPMEQECPDALRAIRAEGGVLGAHWRIITAPQARAS
ncbi:MAG: hypothetical protein ACO27F_12710 [Beijerinckiaceae bacterium]